MKVLWVSRHRILSSQRRELQRMFGADVQVYWYKKVFRDDKEIVDYYRKNKFNIMVIVAPLSVIAKLCELGIEPLWAQMHKGRFIKFKRIKNINIEYEEV